MHLLHVSILEHTQPSVTHLWPGHPLSEHMNELTPGSCYAFPPEAVADTSVAAGTKVAVQNP